MSFSFGSSRIDLNKYDTGIMITNEDDFSSGNYVYQYVEESVSSFDSTWSSSETYTIEIGHALKEAYVNEVSIST